MYKPVSIIKRVSVFVLAFIFLFCSVVLISQPKKVQAFVPVVAIGGAIIASFFAAAGISLTANNIASSSNMNDVLNDLASQYSSSSGAPSIETEMAVKDAYNFYYSDKAGEAIVSVSDRFSLWLNGFKNWFVQNFSLTDSGEIVVLSDKKFTTYNGESYLYYTSFSEFTNGKVPVSSVPVSLSPEVIHLSENYYLVVQGYDDGFMYGYYRPGVRFMLYDALGNFVGSDGHRYASSTPNDFSFIRVCFAYNSYYGFYSINALPKDDGAYNTGGYNLNLSFLNNNTVTTSQIDLSGSLADGYSDFEQALSDARSEAGTDGQVAVNVGEVDVDKPYTQEGIADSILNKSIANTAEGTLVGGYTDEKEVEEENDVERLPTTAEIGENIVLVDGLEDFFPFCIPWDLYNIINILNVEAVAPKFTYKVDLSDTAINTEYEAELDLAPFETVAVVFRAFIIVAFLIFLILKTRDLIRG